MGLLKPLTENKKIRLKDIDPEQDGGMSRTEGEKRLTELREELTELQDLLYAAQESPLLIIFQGMDTSGKDGTIRGVIGAMNPQSCRVISFKAPTPIELAHDYLWRIHAETPSKGVAVIFNRSHYEDVLVVRVRNLVPKPIWQARYDEINQFEKLLCNNKTIILKFFLHITKDEQEQRLLARENDPTKAWKLSVDDWKNRDLWDDYQTAYEDAINRCATSYAPWHVVPANKKWFRNVAVAETIVAAMRPYRKAWLTHLKEIGSEELKALRALRQPR